MIRLGILLTALLIMLFVGNSIASAQQKNNVPGFAAGKRYFTQGTLLLANGDITGGFRMMAVGINLEPDNPHYQSYLLTMLDRTRYNSDARLLEVVLQAAPRFIPAMDRLARLYEGDSRLDDALRLYRSWRDMRPDQAEPYARLGEYYLVRKQYRLAVQHFMAHRRIIGESDYALRRIADAYDQLERGGQHVLLAQLDQQLGDMLRPGSRIDPASMAHLVAGVK